MVRVAINGFGRIGRNVLRALYETGRNNAIQVVAINEIAKPEGIAIDRDALCHRLRRPG